MNDSQFICAATGLLIGVLIGSAAAFRVYAHISGALARKMIDELMERQGAVGIRIEKLSAPKEKEQQ